MEARVLSLVISTEYRLSRHSKRNRFCFLCGAPLKAGVPIHLNHRRRKVHYLCQSCEDERRI